MQDFVRDDHVVRARHFRGREGVDYAHEALLQSNRMRNGLRKSGVMVDHEDAYLRRWFAGGARRAARVHAQFQAPPHVLEHVCVGSAFRRPFHHGRIQLDIDRARDGDAVVTSLPVQEFLDVGNAICR